MEDICDLLEGLWMDVLNEGVGAAAGIGLLWCVFFRGGFSMFAELMSLLAAMV